jgi:hypothetical protein
LSPDSKTDYRKFLGENLKMNKSLDKEVQLTSTVKKLKATIDRKKKPGTGSIRPIGGSFNFKHHLHPRNAALIVDEGPD